jgi:hypothetical protein
MSTFDLSGVVLALSSDLVSIERPAADNFDSHGRSIPRTPYSTFTARCIVYPGGRKLKRDDSVGFSESEVLEVLSTDSLMVRDLLVVPGYLGVFEVEAIGGWQAAGSYCAATARRRQAPFEPREAMP